MTIYYEDIIINALKVNLDVKLIEYKGYLGVSIEGIPFGPFPWELFEEPIEPEMMSKINEIKHIINHKKIDQIIEERT